MAHPLARLGPLLASCLLLLGACSSAGSDDATSDGSSSDGGDSGNGDQAGSETATVDDFGDGVACGPITLSVEAIEAAEGRLSDAAVLAFQAVGLPLAANELWSEVSSETVGGADADAHVIVDPTPLGDTSSYWVRVAQPSRQTSFDGVCSFGTTSSSATPSAPADCSVVADGISITAVWSGADPSAAIAVLRDGLDLHIVPATALAAELQTLLDERREEHAEPPLSSGAEADPESGGFADLGAEPGELHQYSVQAVADGGERSDTIVCGEAQLDVTELDISCGVVTDALGFPVITWEGAGTAQVVVSRDGIALEPQAVVFSSPFVDREAPAGVESSYTVAAGGNEPVPCGRAVSSASTDGPAELQKAASENVIDHKGPFEYVTLEPICAGCDGMVVEIYLVPDLNNDRNLHKVQTVWIDGVESTSATGIWLIDPLFAGPALLEADAAGTAIDFSIDPDTGLIYRWTIGGEGAELTCFEIDTRPIDMRDRCGAQNKLS